MEKFLSAVMILLLPSITSAQPENKSIAAQATFGRYGSDCSSGRGACSFTSSKAMAKTSDFRTSKKMSENTLLLEIKRATLTIEEEIKIAGKPFNQIQSVEVLVFIQQQPLEIDAESLQNLSVNPKYNTILPGNYQMAIDKETVKITFTLAIKN